jgi:hypothetical protein
VNIPFSITGFIASAVLALSATTSHAAPLGGGFHGGSIHGGFAAHSAGTTFRTGSGVRRNFGFRRVAAFNQNRRFFHRDHRVFFPQFVWPGYWYPYFYPNDYSYLDYGPEDGYQYWDNSAASLQSDSSRPAVDHGPSVIIINPAISRSMDTGSHTGYNESGYSSTDAAWQQRTAIQNPTEKIGSPADPGTVAPPRVPQPAQTAAKETPAMAPAQSGPFGKFVVVSWLEDGGKDVIYVQDTETNQIQKITSEPNLDKLRIVELHRNADPKLFEAVISNGSQQGPVRFRF